MSWVFVSGFYMGEKMNEVHYERNFVNSFNEYIFEGEIEHVEKCENKNCDVKFTISKNISQECALKIGDILYLEYTSRVFRYEHEHNLGYYVIRDVISDKINFDGYISLLCDVDTYKQMIIEEKFSEFEDQLNSLKVENLDEKNYIVKMLNDYISKLNDT